MDPRFDYGEFRTIAEVATSSARYETFGFVFEDPGTYVFSTSCDSSSLIVLAVMGEDVRYSALRHAPIHERKPMIVLMNATRTQKRDCLTYSLVMFLSII